MRGVPGHSCGCPVAVPWVSRGCPCCAAVSHLPSCPPRLCRLQGGDQAGPVPAGPGEAVARQLLQVPNVRHHPHRRVHQQVSCHRPATFPGCPPGPGVWRGLSLTPPVPLPRDGIPYCESDYHAQFGIKCETCDRYISGRVLEVSPGAAAAPRRVCDKDMPWRGLGRCHPPSLGAVGRPAAALSQPDHLPREGGRGENNTRAWMMELGKQIESQLGG